MTRQLVIADHVVTGFENDGTPHIIEDGAILVEGDRIVEVGIASALRLAHPGLQEVGGKDRVAIPGLINAHHHVGLTPFQMGASSQRLELWFSEHLAMRELDIRLDTLYSAF